MSISTWLNSNPNMEIQEKHLSASAIRRLKIAAIAVIPIIPTVAGLDFASSESHLVWHLMSAVVIFSSFIAMLYIFVNPLAFSLIQSNKDLDEWGISHKLAAQSFSFRLTIQLILVLWLLSIAASYIPQIPKFEMSVSLYDIGNLMLSVYFFLLITSTAHMAWTVRPITEEDGEQPPEDKAAISARKKKVEAAIIMTVCILGLAAICAGLVVLGYVQAHNAAGH